MLISWLHIFLTRVCFVTFGNGSEMLEKTALSVAGPCHDPSSESERRRGQKLEIIGPYKHFRLNSVRSFFPCVQVVTSIRSCPHRNGIAHSDVSAVRLEIKLADSHVLHVLLAEHSSPSD
jgi:hypothetical protein